jgi:hypothetical protein
MSLYVYAIVERACDPTHWRGLADAPLSTVPHRSLAAVVSAIAALPPRDTATIVRHEALVEALAEHHRTLPVRFGTVVSDARAVEQALSERYESLAADLARIGDKVELGLLAVSRAPLATEDAPGGEGARYLQTRRRAYAGEAVAREVEQSVGDHIVDRRLAVVHQDRVIVRASYLVAPADVGMIRERVDEVRGRRPDLAIVLSGPWPPYSLVSGMAHEAAATHGR